MQLLFYNSLLIPTCRRHPLALLCWYFAQVQCQLSRRWTLALWLRVQLNLWCGILRQHAGAWLDYCRLICRSRKNTDIATMMLSDSLPIYPPRTFTSSGHESTFANHAGQRNSLFATHPSLHRPLQHDIEMKCTHTNY